MVIHSVIPTNDTRRPTSVSVKSSANWSTWHVAKPCLCKTRSGWGGPAEVLTLITPGLEPLSCFRALAETARCYTIPALSPYMYGPKKQHEMTKQKVALAPGKNNTTSSCRCPSMRAHQHYTKGFPPARLFAPPVCACGH